MIDRFTLVVRLWTFTSGIPELSFSIAISVGNGPGGGAVVPDLAQPHRVQIPGAAQPHALARPRATRR